MNETFSREIKFLSHSFDGEKPIKEERTKKAVFKELDRTDKSQHDLHFEIIGLLINNRKSEDPDEPEKKVNLDMAQVGALTKKFIKTLLVPDQNFSETDKLEFLQDSGALLAFSFWAMAEKILPFFQSLNVT